MSVERYNPDEFGEKSSFDELPEAREVFSAGNRASVEFILGYKLSDQEWDELVHRMLEKTYIDPYFN